MDELLISAGDHTCRIISGTSAYVDLGCGHLSGQHYLGTLVLLLALALVTSFILNSRKSNESPSVERAPFTPKGSPRS